LELARLSRRDQKHPAQGWRVRRATLGIYPVNDSSLKGLQHHVSRFNPTRRLRCKLFRNALKSGGIHLQKKHDDDAPPGAQCKFEPFAPAKSQSKTHRNEFQLVENAAQVMMNFDSQGGFSQKRASVLCQKDAMHQTWLTIAVWAEDWDKGGCDATLSG